MVAFLGLMDRFVGSCSAFEVRVISSSSVSSATAREFLATISVARFSEQETFVLCLPSLMILRKALLRSARSRAA
jgi:hypothetical protein